jgi:hypothetical protein
MPALLARYVVELEPNQTTNFTGGNIPPIYSLLLKSFKRQNWIQLRGLQMVPCLNVLFFLCIDYFCSRIIEIFYPRVWL